MEEQNISYTGITQATSDLGCPDGDLSISHNIVRDNGAMRPIWVPEADFKMNTAGDKLLYIHSGTGYKNYIYEDYSVKGLLSAFKIEDGVKTEIGTVYNIYNENLRHIQSVGNTLMIFTEGTIYYTLWKDGSYEKLGDKLPEVPLSFGLLAYPVKYSAQTNEEGNPNGTFKITFNGIAPGDLKKEFSDDNKRIISEQVLAKVNKFIQDNSRDKGMFMYPFFVRYALRLYDGSLTRHSAPILMIPSTRANPIVLWDHIGGEGVATEADLDIFGVPCKLDYLALSSSDEYSELQKWKDIVKGIDIFISEQIYTYDQNGYCDSFIDSSNFETFFIGKYADNTDMGGITGSFTSADWVNASMYYQKWIYSSIYSMHNGGQFPKTSLSLPEVNQEQVAEKIKTCSLFYFVKSIGIDSLSRFNREPIEIEKGYLDNISLKERMTDDYLSHDRIYAGYSYVYNQRLNIANVKREVFRGFRPREMCCYANGNMLYGPSGFIDYTVQNNHMFLYTTVNEGMKNISVISDYDDADPTAFGHYLFYPNPNATKMNVYVSSESHEVPLEEHTGLNGSFYFSGFNEMVTTSGSSTEVSSDNIVEERNKIYTSEVGNPFFFPLGGINTVGVGEILGISSTTRALSQGQFGQFPLLVFSTDGIWAMEVSDTGLYSVKQPVSRDVCSNPVSITQIDGAVVFVTEKGLMVIDGSNVDLLSAELNGPDFDLTGVADIDTVMEKEGITGISGITDPIGFFQTCRIAYDYANQRLVLFNPEKPYAYLFSIDSRSWATMDSGFISSVTDYPDCYMQTGADVINLSTPADYNASASKKIMLMSRPIKLGDDGLKTVNAVVNRGTMEKSGGGLVVFASHDGFKYVPVGSAIGSRVSRLQGSPYKYFRILTVKDMKMNESISFTSIYFTRKWRNKPR